MTARQISRLLISAALVGAAAWALPDYLVSGRTDLDVGAILRYDDNAALVGTIGEGILRDPSGMMFSPAGNVMVADHVAGTVEMFQRDGTYLGKFAEGLDFPIALMALDDDTILVAEYLSGLIKHFGADGTDLGVFANTGLTRTYQLARHPSTGNVLVAGLQEKVILHYAQDGTQQGVFSDETMGQLHSPGGLAFLPDGSLYVAEAHLDEVKLLDSAGIFVRVFANTGLLDPGFVTVDVNWDVLVASYQGDSIRRYAADGTDQGDWIQARRPYHILRMEWRQEEYVPADYTVVRGVEIGLHDPTKIQQSDDQDPATIEQRAQPTPVLPNTELRATMTVAAGDPLQGATLEARLQGNPLPLGTARSELALRNWGTGLLEAVYVEAPMINSLFRTVQVPLDATQRAKYVRASDGAVEASARMFQLAPISPAWRMKVSLVKLTVGR